MTAQPRRGRVIDAFLFNDELDLLEIRLNELDAVADRFVLVESTVTFSGRPKPLVYADHRARYARWHDRIEHVVVEDTPDTGAWRWGRETHQRDAIVRGLRDARCDDLVLLSDLDEIPDPALVAARVRGAYLVDYRMYYVNARQPRGTTVGTIALYAFQLLARGAEATRRARFHFPSIPDGGWHFSYAMPPDRIRAKLRAFSHAEFDNEDIANAVEPRRENLEDLFAYHPGHLELLDPDGPGLSPWLRAHWRRYPDLVRMPSGG